MAIINEKGVVTYKSEVITGTSERTGNPWSRMTIVVSCEGRIAPYDKIALDVFGDKCIDANNFNVGDKVEVAYSVDAREYNGRWFNNVGLFSIKPNGTPNETRPTTDKPVSKPMNVADVQDMPF